MVPVIFPTFPSFGEISAHRPDMAHLMGLDSPNIMGPNIHKRIFLGTPPFRCISPFGVAAGKSDHGQSRPHFSPHIQNHGLRRLPSGKNTHAPTVTLFWSHISRFLGDPCPRSACRFFAKIGPPSQGPDTDRVGISTTIRPRLSA